MYNKILCIIKLNKKFKTGNSDNNYNRTDGIDEKQYLTSIARIEIWNPICYLFHLLACV